jgi:crotonobetainyl-CoA:carnitine CoA-transferase CaiB-like acyl-CoA transferase
MSWLPASQVGADLLPNPIKVVGQAPPIPTKAPTLGQHTDEVLAESGWSPDDIATLRAASVIA